MLSRIALSLAMGAVLFTAPVRLAAESCIFSTAPSQKTCRSSCCADKICCTTSPKNTTPLSQPLAKADSSYKLNAAWAGLPIAVLPSGKFDAQHSVFANVASGAHLRPTLALICIRLI
jgi:hypothetical protein